ncbi:MAG: Fe-S cluster assembly protein SufD [Thermoanaerobaculia bacterium]
MTTIETATQTEPWAMALETLLQERPQEAESIRALRREAFARFATSGFPTTRDEQWRLTSVQPIAGGAWVAPAAAAVDTAAIDALRIDEAALELVFVNGRFMEGLSRLGDQPEGVEFHALDRAFASPDGALASLGRIAPLTDNPFVALNTALMTGGASIVIADGARAGVVHAIFFTTGGAVAVAPRAFLRAGRGSEVTLVETHAGVGRYFTNAVTEIEAGEGSIVHHYAIVDESREAFRVAAIEAVQARSSSLHARLAGTGGALSRTDVGVRLEGEGATCALDGLYLLEDRQHFDAHTRIEHAKPHTESLELYKGVLAGASRGIFNGLIIVRPDAQKIVSRQTNKNLLLSNEAIADSNPQLEIHADDVKCNHGSTIGQIDPTQLFYLRSRGIDLDEATAMLTRAFASEVIERMRIGSIRTRLERLVDRRLAGKESR